MRNGAASRNFRISDFKFQIALRAVSEFLVIAPFPVSPEGGKPLSTLYTFHFTHFHTFTLSYYLLLF